MSVIIPEYEGMFHIEGETYTIESAQTYRRHRRAEDIPIPKVQKGLLIYRQSDRKLSHSLTNGNQTSLSEHHYSCGSHDLHFNKDGSRHYYLTEMARLKVSKHYKRSVPTGCPTQKKVLYMVNLYFLFVKYVN